MQLQATNLLLAKGCVRKMSLSARNILAFVADGCDTCLFMHFVGLMSYVELFCGMSKPSGNKSSLSWSPNGNMLALGSTTL